MEADLLRLISRFPLCASQFIGARRKLDSSSFIPLFLWPFHQDVAGLDEKGHCDHALSSFQSRSFAEKNADLCIPEFVHRTEVHSRHLPSEALLRMRRSPLAARQAYRSVVDHELAVGEVDLESRQLHSLSKGVIRDKDAVLVSRPKTLRRDEVLDERPLGILLLDGNVPDPSTLTALKGRGEGILVSAQRR